MNSTEIKELIEQTSYVGRIIPQYNRLIASNYDEFLSIKDAMSTFVNKSQVDHFQVLLKPDRHSFMRNKTILTKALIFNTAKNLALAQDELLLRLLTELSLADEFKTWISHPTNELSMESEVDLNRIKYSLGTIEFLDEPEINENKGFAYTSMHIIVFHFRSLSLYDQFGRIETIVSGLD